MRMKSILPFAVALAVFAYPSARAGEAPKPAEANAETQAKATYDAAEKTAKEAEAAVVPLKAAMQKADAAFAAASKTANAKRQRATEAKNLSGERGVADLKQAEANVPIAVKALEDATAAKPVADKALADAKAAALPLQQAYDAAEKAAKEAEAAARAAADAANKLDDEAKRATTEATAKRRGADSAKSALTRAQRSEQSANAQIDTAEQKLDEAEAQKKVAVEALAKVKGPVDAAAAAYQAAEQAAQAAAKAVADGAAKPDEEKKKLADDAAAKRKAADAAKAALAQAQAGIQGPQKLVDAAAKKAARAEGRLKMAEAALASAEAQITAATAAAATAEKAAQEAEKLAAEKQAVAAQAAAKRKAVADTAAALAQAQKGEQAAQAQVNAEAKAVADAAAPKKAADDALTNAKNQTAAAAKAHQTAEEAAQAAAKAVADGAAKPEEEKKKLADDAAAKRKAADAAKAALAQAQQNEQAAQAKAAADAKTLTDAEAKKKAADDALANAKNPVAAATTAHQAAQEAAKELLPLDAAKQQTAADAAAKRKAANEAKAALDPVRKKLEEATLQANAAAQKLTQSEARKKSAEEGLENLKKRIAEAKNTHEADEQAAKEAEAAAAPLKAEAEKTRAEYEAALKVADEKRALSEQAKAQLYRLVAARQIASISESPEPPKPANRIDEIVLAKLNTLGIQPVLCSDAVFIRRAYLDLTGKLPTAEEAKAFIQSQDKNKRIALVDRLLDESAHVDYWAMKWCDILRVKAEFPVKVWPNAAQAYHRWVWESIAKNKPYDQFARELLTSSGSNFRVGPVNFYRAIQDKTHEGIASAVGLAFMGARIHLWPEDRRAGMAAFFSQVGYKPTSEWKEEIVFWDPLKSTAVAGSIAPGIDAVAKSVTVTNQIPQTLPQPMSENGPLSAMFPDGTKTTVPPTRDPREAFAEWLIRPENPWFAKSIVNRMWAWAMGRGIIHEPDDIRDDNPPSNPELLAYLEKELVSSGYDLKKLKRLIFTSTTYQFSSIPRHKSPEARANFASYLLRRVEAEVLIDAVNEITGASDLYTSAVPEPFTYIPHDMTAVELADGSIGSSFLTLFGRSARATGMESERVNELASPQWLYMLNSGEMQNKLQSGRNLATILSAGGKPNEIAERLYLTILSRLPTDADMKAMEEYSKTGVTKGRDVWIDLAWALINSPEFLLRH